MSLKVTCLQCGTEDEETCRFDFSAGFRNVCHDSTYKKEWLSEYKTV